MTESEQGSKPVPDPTALTTERVNREVEAAREFVLGEIRHLRELTDQKFAAVSAQFDSVADRVAEQKTDTRDAVDAAFAAAKEAVKNQTEAQDKAIAKSEAAITKQMDALYLLQEKSNQAADEKIDDLKGRLDKLEGRSQGTQMSAGLLFASIGGLAAVIGIIIVLANVLTGSG
jgi:dGTP triphosphohydrolase